MEFKCNDCNKFFTKQQGLDYHNLLAHNDKRKYLCPENGCSSSFKLNGPLRRHIRNVHQGNKSAECSYCKQDFQSNYHAKRHQLKCKMAPKTICAGCKKQAKINENLLCGYCSSIFSPIIALKHIESENSEPPVKNDEISQLEKLKNENLELKMK